MIESGKITPADTTAEGMIPASITARFEQLRPMLMREFGDTAFRSWIAPLVPVSVVNGTLELSVPTRFIRDWVKAHYADRIRALWSQHFAPLSRVEIVVAAKPAHISPVATHTAAPYQPVAVANQNATKEQGEENLSAPLDARFTFAQFVTGRSNELAAVSARRVAEGDKHYNPLYIHGSVGFGKTHLMQAIGHHIRENRKELRVVYMTAEKFMYKFVQALRARDTLAFKDDFRSIDVLMIDDIQFICGKEQTQKEFLDTFKALIDMGKQVVVTGDRSPAELDGIDDHLKSRLTGGLAVEIRQADEDLRLRILQSKCSLLKRDIPADVLSFLAQKITSSIRELEGALNRLIAHTELTGRDISQETVHDLLGDLLRASDRKIGIEDIQKKVAEFYRIRLSDLLSPRRARPVARPRQVAMYLAKNLTVHSLPEIGRKFGGRDHTTIIHGIRKIEELMADDLRLREDVETLKKAFAA